MRINLQQLEREILPLCEVHGVELVAIEWLQGPGRGILRIYIDRPGGDPRTPPDESRPGATADVCAHVSRDVGAVLDGLEDEIPGAYDLEVGSPGFERPVQKRVDFERFQGLRVKVSTRANVEGQRNFDGVLVGVRGEDPEKYRVVLALGPKEVEIPRGEITRARLVEIKPERPAKPGKGPKGPKKPAKKPESTDSESPANTNESEGPLKAP